MSYTIPINVLKQESNAQSYERGMRVYRQNAVKMQYAFLSGSMVYMSADVLSSTGDDSYLTKIEYDSEAQEIVESFCECPAYNGYDGLCKHCVALALKYNRMVNDEEFDFAKTFYVQKTSNALQRVMAEKSQRIASKYERQSSQILPEPVQLIPILRRGVNDQWSAQFKIGTSAHYYVLKNLTEFAAYMEQEEFVSYGKKLSFTHTREAFAPDSLPFLDLIMEIIFIERSFRQRSYGYYYSGGQTKRDLQLTTANLFRLLRAVPDGVIQVEEEDDYHILEQEKLPMLPVTLEPQQDGGYMLTIPPVELLEDQEQCCLVQPGSFLFCDNAFAESLRTASELSSFHHGESYYIAQEDLTSFCATILPDLAKCSNISLEGLEAYLPEPCQLRVYLDDDGFQILCRAEAWYGAQKYLLTKRMPEEPLRDFEQEYQLRFMLEQYFPNWNSFGELYFPYEEDDRLYRLMAEGIERISTLAEVYLSDRMKRIQLQPQPKLQVGVRINGGLLDLEIDAERLPQQELQGLLDSYRQRRKYYRMKNGDFLQLEEGSLTILAELADGLELSGKQLQQGHLQVPSYQAYYVDQVLREGGESLTVQRDLNFRSMIRTLKYYEDSDDEIPVGFTATLRQYQQVGYQWLMSLERMGLGGILADDMGLGKTVQIIALLLAHQEKLKEKPALIVTPASLVYNWENEISRFAPSLTVCSITGSAAERRQLLQKKVQVVLTSYDLLKRDVEQYDQWFSFCIIDEAQNIKNHATKAARAVKMIQADNRFALTGTPIENRLSELWSIFDFLLPGMLGKYETFRQRYELAIVQQQDEVALKRLQKMIQPFILRRLKQDVLKDLPEKIETVVYSKMEPAQRELYVANVQRMLDSLQNKSDNEVHTEKLQILAELTRLRQLCCDPSLLYENYTGGSAKLDTCMELLENAVQSGSKVLVFSQFTTMLDRIQARLQKEKIDYFLLTGSTSKEKRADLVQRFNHTEDAQVFLISLKAGGTGLNLTAASVVIHVDPWWNAAAQEQATDRAHRIGQKQAVTVFQLITKDTIEEKIQTLQAQKLALSDSVIGGQAMSMASLDKNEIMEILRG